MAGECRCCHWVHVVNMHVRGVTDGKQTFLSERASWLLCSMFSFMTGKCQYVLYMHCTFFQWISLETLYIFRSRNFTIYIYRLREFTSRFTSLKLSRKVSTVTRLEKRHSRVIDGPVHTDDRYFPKPNIINARDCWLLRDFHRPRWLIVSTP